MAGSDSINVLSWRGHSGRLAVFTALPYLVFAAVSVVALVQYADATITHHCQQYAGFVAAVLTSFFLQVASCIEDDILPWNRSMRLC